MKAVVYFSLSKNKNSQVIANTIEGDLYEIIPSGKVFKNIVCQMIVYGYKTKRNKDVNYIDPNIDFSKYDEVDLVFPVWGGRPSIFLTKYLEKVNIKNKRIRMIGTSMSGDKNYMKTFKKYVDTSNDIIDMVSYKKTEKA